MSSDGIIFALAILNISYFIQMYKSEIIPNKNIIIYLATGVLIGLIKFPYIFLLLMLFLIPANKFKTKKIAIISKMTALLLIVVAGAYSNFYASKELLKGGRIDYYIQNNVNPANQINYIIHNPASAVITFVKSLIFLPYLIFIKDCLSVPALLNGELYIPTAVERKSVAKLRLFFGWNKWNCLFL